MPAAANDNQPREARSTAKQWLDFLSSTKFGLFILLAVGIVSFLGMFLLQNAPPEQYAMRYGETWGKLILKAGLNNIYGSLSYVFMIFLAALNLVLCSLQRIRTTFKLAFAKPTAETSPLLKNAPVLIANGSPGEVASHLERLLRRRRYALARATTDKGAILAGAKGNHSRLGYLITHVAILVIMVAGVVNGWFGFRSQVMLDIGESAALNEIVPAADFTVRADDFRVETNEAGKISAYKSKLTVLKDGKEILTKEIGVNNPLSYEGLSFYQASYGQSPEKIISAQLVYENGDQPAATIEAPFGESKPIPGTAVKVKVKSYVPHFMKDLSTGVVSSRSSEPKMPAVQIEICNDTDEVIESGWFIRGMNTHSAKGELSHLKFVDYKPLFYTGIDIASNPGMNLLLVGFTIACIGFYFSFLIHQRRLWVSVAPRREKECEVRIAGVSRSGAFALQQEILQLYAIIESQQKA